MEDGNPLWDGLGTQLLNYVTDPLHSYRILPRTTCEVFCSFPNICIDVIDGRRGAYSVRFGTRAPTAGMTRGGALR